MLKKRLGCANLFVLSLVGLMSLYTQPASAASSLRILDITFATKEQPDTLREPPVYTPGETVKVEFAVNGYKMRGDKTSFRTGLTVLNPNGNPLLVQDNLGEFNLALKKGQIPYLDVKIHMPDSAKPGKYSASITVSDLYANQNIKFDVHFELKASSK